jgi:hypothetical protein
MAAIGLAVGGAAAIPMSRLMSGFLFGIEPVDPPTIAIAAVIMVVVALTAAWIPNCNPLLRFRYLSLQ